ncbi:glycosyltransferase family 2 protein [Halonatronum saccharophilum]|uniref:glycosyltransferase family 2 protein n=1 Tax=Halonatronum saccharophilum TaxID=150060 RepID=UPI00048929E3|nr:glycosyltransferase family 2 protein [Halonatronum saccharophilum]
MNSSISILIPAYNEGDRIEKTVTALRGLNNLKEIIVIDDGSKDDTYLKADRVADKVICLESNQGKGVALDCGLEQAFGDVILLVDADLGESATEAKKLVGPVVEGKAHMAIAKFPPAKIKGGFGLVKGLANFGLERMLKQSFESPLSGQRAIAREVLEGFPGFSRGFGVEVGLTIDAHRRGYKIVEVEVDMTHRETGRDLKGFLHRGKQFKDIAKVLLSKGRANKI